jgi:hypothetical protein
MVDWPVRAFAASVSQPPFIEVPLKEFEPGILKPTTCSSFQSFCFKKQVPVLENQEAPEQPSSAESEVQQIAVINCKNCASKAAQIGLLPTSSRHKLTQSMWLATFSLSFPFAFDQVPVAHLQVA